MSLYAIGDLHLHFQAELKNRNQLISRVWKDHEQKFLKYCRKYISDQDTLVLVGDHSWGRKLTECTEDLRYIKDLPGRKILLRGNHDMFWDVKKTGMLNELFQGELYFLQDNYYSYKDFAIVGTKGYTFEGPFYLDPYRQITGWDKNEMERSVMLVKREEQRLRTSFEEAKKAGYQKCIMFLHYPPTNILEKESAFTKIAEEYHAEQVIYAHCHGESRFYDSILGIHNGICYRLVSGDYLKWKPERILE